MNEYENRCSTTDPVQTLCGLLYVLALAAALLLGAVQF